LTTFRGKESVKKEINKTKRKTVPNVNLNTTEVRNSCNITITD